MFVTRTPNGFEPKRDDGTSAAEQLAPLGIIISARADNNNLFHASPPWSKTDGL
jgi:hypothetical protein